MTKNIDAETVKSFGNEWSLFDQSEMSIAEAAEVFDDYFSIFPWTTINESSSGFDMGCGSGRWAKIMAPRVGHLHCIEPSPDALNIAISSLKQVNNVSFHLASVDEKSLPDNSQDFGYSLGVLHHVPDTLAAIGSCVAMLKQGAPLLLYLYYSFDNRPIAYKAAWRASDIMRRIVCKLPDRAKHFVTNSLAALIYFPLARTCLLLEKMHMKVTHFPLAYYRHRSYYTMQTDARDRFGTPLEKRFSQKEIYAMMEFSGLHRIYFSRSAPFWCVVGIKK